MFRYDARVLKGGTQYSATPNYRRFVEKRVSVLPPLLNVQRLSDRDTTFLISAGKFVKIFITMPAHIFGCYSIIVLGRILTKCFIGYFNLTIVCVLPSVTTI